MAKGSGSVKGLSGARTGAGKNNVGKSTVKKSGSARSGSQHFLFTERLDQVIGKK